MDVPAALIAAFPPSNQQLLDVTRQQIDDDGLWEIAVADYGVDAETHLAALRPIRDQGIVPTPLGWHPGEVLELIRWCNPDQPNEPPFEPGPTGRRGHQIRAFACAALLRAGAEHDPAFESTLAQCLVSAKMLDEPISEAAARFLTWEIPRIGADSWVPSLEGWLYPFALLVIALRLREGRISDRTLGEAAAWVLAEESAARREIDPSNPPPGPFGVIQGHWKPLAVELIENAATIEDNAVRSELEFIGTMLRDEG